MDENKPDMHQYRTWVFDCDGVLLNSNRVKTGAFYRVAEPYGEDKAQALVDYHVRNGGISRYVKFQYFLTDIVGRTTVNEQELASLLENYALRVREGLLNCEAAAGLDRLRALTRETLWLVVSGGDQQELRDIFLQRGLNDYFDGGIYGSPQTKDEILERLREEQVIMAPAVFVGDSQYDVEAAKRVGLDFIFLSNWSESSFDFAQADFKLKSIASIVSRFNES